jgi:diguanylate cyclase (GGDEF)-like protein
MPGVAPGGPNDPFGGRQAQAPPDPVPLLKEQNYVQATPYPERGDVHSHAGSESSPIMTSPPPRTSSEPTTPRLDARDRVAILGFTMATVAVVVLVGLQLASKSGPSHPLIVIGIALGFTLAERMVFHVEARNEAVGYTPSEVALAVSMLLLAPVEVVVARLMGSLIGMTLVRRPPLFKLLFNAAHIALETTLALLIFTWLSSTAGDGLIESWLVLAASLSVALVMGGVVVTLAIAQFDGDLGERLRRTLSTAPVMYLPTIIFASSVALPMSIDPWLGLIALAPAPLVWLVLRSHGMLLHRFTDLASVHDFSRTVGDATDLPSIADAAASEISHHLRAERVVVRFWALAGVSTESLVGLEESPSLPTGPATVRWRSILSDRELHHISNLDPDLRTQIGIEDFEDGLLAPIVDEVGPLGVVLIGERNGATDRFDDDDANRLSAMTQQLAVAVRKGHLHEQITFEATHDRLTSLPNRTFFEERIERAAANGENAAVLLVDLDRFKQINDTFGHHAGDILLIEAARRIRTSCVVVDVVARFGGDEFAIFAPGLSGYEAQLLAENVSASLEEAFDIGPANVAIGASIGIALMPAHGESATGLLRLADIAMYDAKARRIRSSTYREELKADNADRLTLLDDLRTALRNRQLEVHFQPQVDLASGSVCGAEALARWEHPELGRIPPDDFIELAEQAGLIEELTGQVLELATDAAAAWHAKGQYLNVSVNISAQSLLDERLEALVEQALRTSGLNPAMLMLEITESTMMAEQSQTHRVLNRLSRLGIRLSVDDFGTGFSSLVNLRQLPVDEIKVDKSFVMEMMLEHDDDVIVRSTIDLGHNLGLSVVAEGVETAATQARLREFGCDIAQGYGISRPLPRDRFERWLEDRRTVPIPDAEEPAS